MAAANRRAPTPPQLEFGGPLGSALLLLLLPATLFHLLLTCRSGPCSLLSLPAPLPAPHAFWSPRALLLLLGWLGLQAALYLLPLGPVAEGTRLPDHTRLRYPVNGFRALGATAALVGAGLAAGLPLDALVDLLLPLASAAALTAAALSVFLYLKARRAPPCALAPGGNTGHPLYDFFLGRELNPRVGAFDLKYFCPAEPGPAAAGGRAAGGPALSGHGPGQRLPAALRGRRPLARAIGYYIFRGANSQKNIFRRDPTDPRVAGLQTIPTATGRRLLVSGWWGLVRHPNYLGDLIMALAWSLPCGVTHLLPYFYVLYFTALLVHREARDERQCLRKYGLAWRDYCRRVPYRILPYVY
ncbi:delta(14)-sterol reductase TM7SF2 isoform X2 [Ornithorhynchus anatinus]|uniref:delta(14)-sterol reductase TM7SF2 isoform X2 n=1 Tax=Ornithorhynchus anatinus TaxID=9258 RepID=UPI0010A7DE4D|nr:delta(14)-sterol reductase TM7SF2 isoform X2 [Ornithorhynchus anatinus]